MSILYADEAWREWLAANQLNDGRSERPRDVFMAGYERALKDAAAALATRIDHSWDWSGTVVQDSIVDWLSACARSVSVRADAE